MFPMGDFPFMRLSDAMIILDAGRSQRQNARRSVVEGKPPRNTIFRFIGRKSTGWNQPISGISPSSIFIELGHGRKRIKWELSRRANPGWATKSFRTVEFMASAAVQ